MQEGSFGSFRPYKNSGDKETPGLVTTKSGHLHYIERRVTLGFQKPKGGECVATSTAEAGKSKTPRRTKSEGNIHINKVGEHMGFQKKTPVIGEQRHVTMDMQWAKFGFQLKSYGRMSNRGKEQQTIVQNVTIGSPAFMAGLHQGDAIIKVNGEDVRNASPDEVVNKIIKTGQSRVHLIVEFIDGVKRNNLRKKQTELKKELIDKQEILRKLLSSKQCLTSYKGVSRPPPSTTTNGWKLVIDTNNVQDTNEGSSGPLSPVSPGSVTDQSMSNRQVASYTNDILSLVCDVLVVPLGNPVYECEEEDSGSNQRLLTRLLHAGGDKLINELSLAKYCPLGSVITTSGGEIQGIKSVCHCVFGTTDQQLMSCFSAALEKAAEHGAVSVTFWIDGFFSMGISPSKVLEILFSINNDDHSSSSRVFDGFGAIIMASSTVPGFENLVIDIFHHPK